MAFRRKEMMKKMIKKVGENDLAPRVKEQIQKCIPDNKVVMGRAKGGLYVGRHIQFGKLDYLGFFNFKKKAKYHYGVVGLEDHQHDCVLKEEGFEGVVGVVEREGQRVLWVRKIRTLISIQHVINPNKIRPNNPEREDGGDGRSCG
ncbi:hypothetical protein CCACVL1_17730 [Corchorus capsularis]|uniref:Uncharacterized protein n=1 Tax=Corchorus capsularis TaxID=210143 RepID=A0A1R3HQ69_COCAP|nr:hypothetical protein CCACVL1_17730 [Corchorus capsularis]